MENTNKTDLAVETKKANEISLQVREISTIKSQKELEIVKNILIQVKKGKDYIKEKEAIAYAAVKSTRETWKPIKDKLLLAEEFLKKEVDLYREKITKKVEEKKEEVAKKVEGGEMTFEKAGEKMEKVEEKKDAFKTRKVREVIIGAPDLVPSKYWKLDEVMVRRDALADIDIPGVKVIEKEITIT